MGNARTLTTPPVEKMGVAVANSPLVIGADVSTLEETDLQDFIREQNLAPYIEIAVKLVTKHFSTSPVLIDKEYDPEFPDEWVCLHVRVSGGVETIVDAYDAFTKDMVANVPSNVGRKIRLSMGTT